MSEEAVVPVVEPSNPVAFEPTPQDIAPVAPVNNYADMIGSLSDDMGNHSALKKYQSFEDLAKSHINAQSLIGKKGEDFWTSEDAGDIARRNEIMGVPKDASGYELAKPADFPEDVPYNEAYLGQFAEFAKKLGMPKDMAAKLVEWEGARSVEMMGELNQRIEADFNAANDQLSADWGNKKDYNIAKVKQATDYLGITDTLNETGMANNPQVLKMILEKIVPAISDDKLIEGAKSDNLASVTDTLTELENKMMQNPKAPEYASWVKERTLMLQKLT